ncbi:MAG TPA: alpha/beta hydrolase [Solirubrobacteraceae bacterium]|nr:alpha/beta hydrolase [Solirubrobacteraceae bacterium]
MSTPWIDPELVEGMQAADDLPLAVGDIAGRRSLHERLLREEFSGLRAPDNVLTTDFRVPAADGSQLLARWYSPPGPGPGSAGLYCHGGGMILGSVDLFDPLAARYVSSSAVPLLAIDYRLAPEFPYPTPIEDVYAGLVWLHDHASELGVDPDRMFVMGDSAGGCLAAAVSLLARDRGGPRIARQILIYPMLDDRTTTPDPRFDGVASWTYDDNATGWSALLGDAAGTADVAAHAAPARARDLAGLPPAYIDVGDLDIFLDEDLEYALRLSRAGIPTELHVHPGAPHGFESLAWGSSVATRSLADRVRVIRSV